MDFGIPPIAGMPLWLDLLWRIVLFIVIMLILFVPLLYYTHLIKKENEEVRKKSEVLDIEQ